MFVNSFFLLRINFFKVTDVLEKSKDERELIPLEKIKVKVPEAVEGEVNNASKLGGLDEEDTVLTVALAGTSTKEKNSACERVIEVNKETL